MLRAITSQMMIVILLACPYLCMGSADAGGLGVCMGNTCACQHTDTPSDSQLPSDPTDGHSDCLCHGAVADAGLRTSDVTPVTAWIEWIGSSPILQLAPLVPGAHSLFSQVGFRPVSSGRDVCVSICALLI